MAETVVHAVVTVALLAAYVVVTAIGEDGNPLFGVLIGWIGSGATVGAIQKAKGAPSV